MNYFDQLNVCDWRKNRRVVWLVCLMFLPSAVHTDKLRGGMSYVGGNGRGKCPEGEMLNLICPGGKCPTPNSPRRVGPP